ncbi:MAG: hypothetical protein JJ992_12575, partial [Planctomycetes bacterium]|nr:hypothetical protein [Planctomycetota bacterium]
VSLAVPSLRKFSQKGQLKDAARQLRAELLAARLRAIESATCTCFVYQPGSEFYTIRSAAESVPGDEMPATMLLDTALDEAPVAGDQASDEETQRSLAFGARFVGRSADEDAPPLDLEPAAEAEEDWSEPLIFYPNGRALNARIRLASDRYWIDFTVRGFTGTVQLSPIQKIAESDDSTAAATPEMRR